MSRIGKKPIEIPKEVEVKVEKALVKVKGPKGTLQWRYPLGINVEIEDGKVVIKRTDDTRHKRALHGLTRSLIANMIKGVSEGYKKELEIVGVGYRVDLKENKFIFSVGYSHPVEYKLPEGIKAEINHKTRPVKIIIYGIDKQIVGQVAADLRAVRPPDAYKGKGIRYVGEHLKLKPGKAAK